MTRHRHARTSLSAGRSAAVLLAAAALVLTASTSSRGQTTGTAASSAPAENAPAAGDAAAAATRISQAGVVTIDVRTPEESAQGHVDGARNSTWGWGESLLVAELVATLRTATDPRGTTPRPTSASGCGAPPAPVSR